MNGEGHQIPVLFILAFSCPMLCEGEAPCGSPVPSELDHIWPYMLMDMTDLTSILHPAVLNTCSSYQHLDVSAPGYMTRWIFPLSMICHPMYWFNVNQAHFKASCNKWVDVVEEISSTLWFLILKNTSQTLISNGHKLGSSNGACCCGLVTSPRKKLLSCNSPWSINNIPINSLKKTRRLNEWKWS